MCVCVCPTPLAYKCRCFWGFDRGGGELGRTWYEDGKLTKKKNSFNDFIDVAQFLIDQKLTAPRYLAAAGTSAGGLLVGAMSVMRPGTPQFSLSPRL